MSESLVIRLGTNKQQPVALLVWSSQEQEIIASGTLPSADALSDLQERAGGRPVVTLFAQGRDPLEVERGLRTRATEVHSLLQ